MGYYISAVRMTLPTSGMTLLRSHARICSCLPTHDVTRTSTRTLSSHVAARDRMVSRSRTQRDLTHARIMAGGARGVHAHTALWARAPSGLTPRLKARLLEEEKGEGGEGGQQDYFNRTMVSYAIALIVTMLGLCYAAVPLYKIFCQQYGLGGVGLDAIGHNTEKVASMQPVRDRPIKVTFAADTHARLKWDFHPMQHSITVVPGETALAFFRARNPTNEAITGVATYNVLPYEAGVYFNKIQCFCFEEQRLNPKEEVDMPVFFYIDPEYDLDPELLGTDSIVLGYNFFEAKPGMEIPLPGFMQQPPPAVVRHPET